LASLKLNKIRDATIRLFPIPEGTYGGILRGILGVYCAVYSKIYRQNFKAYLGPPKKYKPHVTFFFIYVYVDVFYYCIVFSKISMKVLYSEKEFYFFW
jgi:hypothetical protein